MMDGVVSANSSAVTALPRKTAMVVSVNNFPETGTVSDVKGDGRVAVEYPALAISSRNRVHSNPFCSR